MAAAIGLGERGRGRTSPNPNVGCIIVDGGRVVGRGWTQPGGRPHAEAMALDLAGSHARGAVAYVTLEPCAHESPRGPSCAQRLIESGIGRVVAATGDPDLRTNGAGFTKLRAAGIAVESGVLGDAARRSMTGFFTRQRSGRPSVTLKLAVSLDGRIALADGTSRWITGDAARRHVHLERARHAAILVGRGTFDADRPSLDVRLPGLEARSPAPFVLSDRMATADRPGWGVLARVEDIGELPFDSVMIEGGAGAAAAFLRADLVDRLLLYTAPIVIGGGLAAIGDIGLHGLSGAHGRWRRTDSRQLGPDRLDVYERCGR